MNGLPYYKAYPRDFIEGTIGMSFELKGAYRLALDLIYMQGGNLPDDARYISGLLGCTIRKWKSLRDELVSLGKLTVNGEFLTNERAVFELETLRKLRDSQAENARGTRKNKGLEKPPLNHTEPEPEPVEKEDTNVSSQKPSSKSQKGTRLSGDWTLPKSWGVWAVTEGGLPEADVRQEASKFRDYWIGVAGRNGVKLDWQATWRNWIRKAVTDRPKHQKSNTGGYGAFGNIPERC